MNIARYSAADLPALMDKITKNSIGMDEYFDRLFALHETTSNYPPYNLIQVNNVESHLEIALAGFKKKEVYVFTEYGKLFVEGQKEDTESERTFVHKGLAQRSYIRRRTSTDRTWESSSRSSCSQRLSINIIEYRRHCANGGNWQNPVDTPLF